MLVKERRKEKARESKTEGEKRLGKVKEGETRLGRERWREREHTNTDTGGFCP